MDGKKNELIGIIYGILAYSAWGILPLYWKLLSAIPAHEILAHRIFWSFIFVGGLMFFSGSWQPIRDVFKSRSNIILIFLCAVIISVNWGIYIWAVNSKQVVEASMGYYINPLVVFLFSVTILKEQLNTWQIISIILAAIGVIIITVQYGKVPWIALGLALTFALYGLLKKILKVDSLVGLAIETTIIAPVALAYILYRQSQGTGAVGVVSLVTTLILFASGIATATPLLWFAKAAQRIKFSTIGFLQYIAPTITLFLGVVIFKEQFTTIHLLSFSFIWAALIIYSLSNVGFLRKKVHQTKLIKEVSKI
ncbi:MAG: chloramphenicol-sensitive protein RarD [Clostridia bacterium]|jgi:chloramphenicol-sensitive protein RarD|nr:chloramphenicol-sensitive protein RarD [Clostridia bacterium]MDN5321872.1 chloramphenicol-sensitive protein RarD [Clostridia bacterium]